MESMRTFREARELPDLTLNYGPAAFRNGLGVDDGGRFYVSGLLIGSRAVALMGVRAHLWPHERTGRQAAIRVTRRRVR
jgi:hypothetical protein